MDKPWAGSMKGLVTRKNLCFLEELCFSFMDEFRVERDFSLDTRELLFVVWYLIVQMWSPYVLAICFLMPLLLLISFSNVCSASWICFFFVRGERGNTEWHLVICGLHCWVPRGLLSAINHHTSGRRNCFKNRWEGGQVILFIQGGSIDSCGTWEGRYWKTLRGTVFSALSRSRHWEKSRKIYSVFQRVYLIYFCWWKQ